MTMSLSAPLVELKTTTGVVSTTQVLEIVMEIWAVGLLLLRKQQQGSACSSNSQLKGTN